MKKTVLLLVLMSLLCSVFAQSTLKIMAYNLLKFPEALPVNREDTLAKILNEYEIDILGVSELMNSTGSNAILNKSLNVGTSKYRAASYTPATFGDLQQMLYYNSDKLALYSQDTIQSNTRDFNKYILYPLTQELEKGDTIFLDVYVCHLKAGQNADDSIKRIRNVQYLINNLAQETQGRNRVLMGDLNLYTSGEEAYQLLTSGVQNYFNDPISKEGNWHNNAIYKEVFTQSTRSSQLFGEGAGGGVDDRFDFVLVSNSLMDLNNDIFYKENTYEALGNNGTCFNKSITDCDQGNSLLTSLYNMSDHLPVVAELALKDTDFISDIEVSINKPNAWLDNMGRWNINLGEPSEFVVYNSLGQVVLRSIESSKEHLVQQTTSMSNGVYFVYFSSSREYIKVSF